MIVKQSSKFPFNTMFYLIPNSKTQSKHNIPSPCTSSILIVSPSLWVHDDCSTLFLHSIIAVPLSFCIVAKFRVYDGAHDLVNVPSCGVLRECSDLLLICPSPIGVVFCMICGALLWSVVSGLSLLLLMCCCCLLLVLLRGLACGVGNIGHHGRDGGPEPALRGLHGARRASGEEGKNGRGRQPKTQLVPCLQCARSAVCSKRWVLVQAKQPNLCHVLRLLVQACI
jgi:hypothetical protein